MNSLIEELGIIPRFIYSAALILIVTSVTHVATPTLLMKEGVLVVGFSFVWQYYVLHFMLHRAVSKNGRVVTLFMWMVMSFIFGAGGVYALANLDALQNKASFGMAIYLTAASMFVAGVCTKRAFAKHNAL